MLRGAYHDADTGYLLRFLFVGDSPLVDSKNNVVGLMTAESFVENPGEQINAIQTTTLTLYFSNRDGDALVKETQTVHYSSNISIEKLVIEHLLKTECKRKISHSVRNKTAQCHNRRWGMLCQL